VEGTITVGGPEGLTSRYRSNSSTGPTTRARGDDVTGITERMVSSLAWGQRGAGGELLRRPLLSAPGP
jgi:hypothetical protein